MPASIDRIALDGAYIGTSRSLTVYRFGTPGARPKVYIQAGLHADEIPGLLVAHHLLGLLADADVTGEVVVVPVANPVGLAQTVEGTPVGRAALDGAGNFNRGFADLTSAAAERLTGRIGANPAANVAAVRAALAAAHAAVAPRTEVEHLRHMLLGLALDADLVLDLHCDMEAVVHLYTGDALWPGFADLSAELGAEAVLLAAASGGEPFDEACAGPWWALAERFAADGPIPPACAATTVELRGKADVDDAHAEADAAALLRLLMRRGAVAGDPGPVPPARCAATPLSGLARVVAPAAGVVVLRAAVGAQVQADDPVADLLDPTAPPERARRTLTAPVDGLLMARTNRRFAGAGDLIASIAGTTPLPQSGRGLLFD